MTILVYVRDLVGEVHCVDMPEGLTREELRRVVGERCGLVEGLFELEGEEEVAAGDELRVRELGEVYGWEHTEGDVEDLRDGRKVMVVDIGNMVDENGLAHFDALGSQEDDDEEDSLFMGFFYHTAQWVPDYVRHLHPISPTLRETADCFISNLNHLRTINLSSLPSLTTFRDGFLEGCPHLTHILFDFTNVTKIGSNFCLGCAALETLPIHAPSLTQIHQNFMSGCSKLTTLRITAPCNVATIGKNFLCACSSLREVDLTGLANVTRIRSNFLSNCTSLTAINISTMSSLVTIDDEFLQGCTSLTSFDLSPHKHLTSIGTSFLRGCTALTELDLPQSELTVKKHFLRDCPGLGHIDRTNITEETCEFDLDFLWDHSD